MNIRNTRPIAAALLLVLTAACSACTSTRTAAPTALPTGRRFPGDGQCHRSDTDSQ